MPLNPNILALLRQGMTGNAQSNAPQGIDPNLEMILQGMGMMPRRLDMQGRPIVGRVENPSNMDQHYARQGNTEAMRQRYSSPTFAMGPNDPNRRAPATPLPPQGAITARQPVTGLPGQVGPAYGMQQTPINMFPSPEEGDAMDNVRKQYRKTMQQGRAQPQTPAPAMAPSATVGVPGYTPYQQGAGDWLRPLQIGAKNALSTGQYINDRQNAQASLEQEYAVKRRPFVEMRARHRNNALDFTTRLATPGWAEAQADANWEVQNQRPTVPEMFQWMTGIGQPWRPKAIPSTRNTARFTGK